MESVMAKRLAAVAVLGLLCLGTGCATLRGDTQKMKIESEPAGAQLTVDGKAYTTPAEVELKRKDAHRIAITKDGYRPITFNLESTWDGASMTDLALPGGSALMGLAVVRGADREFNQLGKIKLERTTEPSPKPLEMFQYRGKLLTKAEYDQAMEAEAKDKSRFMGPENN
jgi:hypothetical protein